MHYMKINSVTDQVSGAFNLNWDRIKDMRIVIADILEKIKIESPSSYSVQKSKENPVLLLEMSSLLNRSFLNLCEFLLYY